MTFLHKPSQILLAAVAFLAFASTVVSQSEIRGKVTQLQSGRARVDFDTSGAAIAVGGRVLFSTTIEGLEVAAGSGVVSEVGSGFLWVGQVDSRVTLGMDARFVAGAITPDAHLPSTERVPPPPPKDPIPPPTPVAPSVDLQHILAKNLEAVGGLEAWNEVSTLVQTGTIWNGGVEGTFSITLKRPGSFRWQSSFGKMGGLVEASNGTRGWTSLRTGPQPKKGKAGSPITTQPLAEETLSLRSIDLLYSMATRFSDWMARGRGIRLVGEELLRGSPAYRVEVELPTGAEVAYFFDTTSYLVVQRSEMSPGSVGTITTFSDFRQVQGVRLPHTVVTALASGGILSKTTVLKSELNSAVDDSIFEAP